MQRNIDCVKALYAAFGRGDVEAILSRLAPDVQWEHDWGADPLPLLEERRGRAAVPGFFALLDGFEFLRFEPYDFLASESRVVALIATHLRCKATGRDFRDLEAHLWRFDAGGQVTQLRHLCDTRQLGWAMGVAAPGEAAARGAAVATSGDGR